MRPTNPDDDAPDRTARRVEKPQLPHAELRRLLQRSDLRSAFIVAATMSGVVALFTVVIRYPGVWTYLAGFVLVGGLQHHLSIIQHEANHYLLFSHRRVNEVFLALVSYSVGFTRAYRKVHLKHHRRLGHDDDPDLHNYEHYPSGVGHFLKDMLAHLSGLGAAVQFLSQAVSRTRDRGDAATASAPQAPSFDRELIGVAAVQLCGLALLWALGVWYLYFVLWLLPLVTLTKTLVHLRNIVEHTLIEDVGDSELSRYRTIRCNPIEQFFFAPLYFNYHAEHHLYPSIPYFNLPAAYRLLCRQEAYRRAVDVERGYLRFLITKVVAKRPARLHPRAADR